MTQLLEPTLLIIAGLFFVLGIGARRYPKVGLNLAAKISMAVVGSALTGALLIERGPISGYFLLVAVTATLAAAVFAFSARYMAGDPAFGRYAKYVIWLLAPLLVAMGTDSIVLFVAAWCLGSWLVVQLVTHDRSNPAAISAAARCRRIFIVGDSLFVLGAAGIVGAGGSLSFSKLDAVAAAAGNDTLLSAACIAIVAGAVVRCALLPGHRWLLASMTAPTPVSALLHAGFVNAGGIACLKFAPVLLAAPAALRLLLVVAVVSAVGGAVVLMMRRDIKGRLAGSTITQMAYMLIQCACGAYAHAVFHLIAHSLYKAHAFLRAGSAASALAPDAAEAPRHPWLLWVPNGVFISLYVATGMALPDVLLLTFLSSLAAETAVFAKRSPARFGAVASTIFALLVAGAIAIGGPLLLANAIPQYPLGGANPTGEMVLLLAMTAALSMLAYVRATRLEIPAALFAAASRLAFPNQSRGRLGATRQALRAERYVHNPAYLPTGD